MPDVFIRRTDQGWSVELNAGSVPRLKVNQGYAGLVSRSADYASLRAQLSPARSGRVASMPRSAAWTGVTRSGSRSDAATATGYG
mgnify:CR=1 FL=1